MATRPQWTPSYAISQIYRNFLLTESYRIKEPAHEAYSVVLAPKDHPTTQQEVASLREELKEEFQKPFNAPRTHSLCERVLKAMC